MALVIERKIQEYIIKEGLNTFNMPKDAYICGVGVNENGSSVLWAEVKTPRRMKDRNFRVIRSKWPIVGKKSRYIGTFNKEDGTPWHVYEEVK